MSLVDGEKIQEAIERVLQPVEEHEAGFVKLESSEGLLEVDCFETLKMKLGFYTQPQLKFEFEFEFEV